MQYIYTMKGLGKVHPPDAVVLKDIWLSFLPGAKIGVLGLNGAGKSSLLRIMAGEDHEFIGEAFPADGISVGFLPQEPRLDPTKDVKGNVEEGVAEIKALLDRYDELNMKLGEDMSPEAMDKLLEEQGRLQDRIDAVNAWDIDSQLELAMDALRCPPPDADVATLSGGERRRVALCRLLLRSPDLLLLDEPTNHLDAESVAWLERFLKEYKGTVVAVTHDRYFLDNVAEWILELDRGSGIPWKGNYSSWLEQKQQRLTQEEKTETKRQKTLARELEWIRMSPRARQSKGKARLNAYEQLLNEDTAQKIEQVEIYIPPGPRLGDMVVEARGLRKAYGDLLLIDDLNFTLPRGGIVGVIGPNGAGKTTLFRMITAQEKPDGGTLRLGETVQLGYVDQSRDALAPNKSVWGRDFPRRRRTDDWQAPVPVARLCVLVQLQGVAATAEGGNAVGRRTQPRAPRQAPAARVQPVAARRAHQRPGRRHAPRARRSAAQLRGLRRRHQPRSVVPRPHCYTHAGVRGR
jgi:ATP-binding cassette ChvD family protein